VKRFINPKTILSKVRLGPAHKPTGRTRHYLGDQELAPPSELQVVTYAEEPGYYLLYIDADGRELTDTYHDSLEIALQQAEWEFQVKQHEWEAVT